MKWKYAVMHLEKTVATIQDDGLCTIQEPVFLPYNLYLEEDEDFSARIQNLENFMYWCASRLLPLDRVYLKEILNAIGGKQGTTDRERAGIALSYHCLSLTDVFWVRKAEEELSFADINLYEHSLSDAFVATSLFGRSLTAENARMLTKADSSGDIATQGVAPKAWIRRDGHFLLLKDGESRDVEAELLASRIARCFTVDQVLYEPFVYEGQAVSCCRLATSLRYGMAPMEHVEIFAVNHDTTRWDLIQQIDAYGFHMMNIVDYLIGNTDRHWGNWGFLIDHDTNQPVKLHPLMDFNKSFLAYDTMEGTLCLTTSSQMSQKEAALVGARAVGLNQNAEISRGWFADEARWEMFNKRLEILKNLR